MATSGIGIDVGGNLLIGQRTPAQGGSAFIVFGQAANGPAPLVINNTSDPPTVNIAGAPVGSYSSEYYSLIGPGNVTVADGEDVVFTNAGPSTSNYIAQDSSTIFDIIPGQYDVTWQLSTNSACQVGLYCHAGFVGNFSSDVSTSIVGIGTTTDQITGRFMFVAGGDNSGTCQFSLRNYSGADLVLVGNAGGASQVAASIVIRHIGPPLSIA